MSNEKIKKHCSRAILSRGKTIKKVIPHDAIRAVAMIEISMTTKHDPYENAVAERVNGILKDEYAIESFKTQKEAQKEIKSSIRLYNTDRPHLSCGYRTPKQAHEQEGFILKKWPFKKTPKDISLGV